MLRLKKSALSLFLIFTLVFSLLPPKRSEAAVLGGIFAIALSAESLSPTTATIGVMTGTIMVLTGIALSAVVFILGPAGAVNATIGSAILILEENPEPVAKSLPFLAPAEINNFRALAKMKKDQGIFTFQRSEVESIMERGDYLSSQVDQVIAALVLP